jgi:hypothetical protein
MHECNAHTRSLSLFLSLKSWDVTLLMGTFATYSSHLSLSSCYIEDWAFPQKSIYIFAILLSVFTFLHTYTKNPKIPIFILFFLLNLLTNTSAPRGFDNLFYIKRYYNWSPPLGSHQEATLEGGSGSHHATMKLGHVVGPLLALLWPLFSPLCSGCSFRWKTPLVKVTGLFDSVKVPESPKYTK